MPGYDPDFLGQTVPLPDFSPSLIGFVLNKPELVDSVYAHYHNYTVAMNKDLRTPLFAALNIDQAKIHQVNRIDDWRIDTRIGAENQLNNDYYFSNPWDRGHLARRSSAAWGDSRREAKLAADDTFYYSNAALQHGNFNQDEWLAL
ncbi:MAG: endonuclease, partial [Leptolyngbya sp. SIO1D8]|nr:endonuclease [Leptolyngbya sp. SIO1D8]